MKTILVPCDFSEPSMQAVRFAVDIAKKSRGVITLLHVVELPVLYDSSAVLAFEAAHMEERKNELEKVFGRLKARLAKDAKIKSQVEFGAVVPVIRRVIKEIKADLVVMGTHGATGIKEFTIGSNAEKIVRSSPVPVISLRKAPKEVRNIVFPTNPDLEMEDLTMNVKSLQDFFDAKLHLVYINTPARFKRDFESQKELQEFAKRFMLKNVTVNVFNDLTEEEGIAAFAKGVKADMIAMRTHGRRGLNHFAMGSIAEDAVNHIDSAIWTYKVR